MTRRKKILLTAVAVLLVVGGIFGGTAIVSAQDDETVPADQSVTLLEKIGEIYQENTGTALDTEQLKAAFQQAMEEMRNDRQAAMLDKLVEEGVITQEQADEYQTWLDAKPDINIGRSDLGKLPFRNMQPRFGGMRGFQGWCFEKPESTTAQ
ncbi:MAG: DUF2680 domain-containing protein [Dehalococcoidales bacterium]|nr:DUF2680 domain-containing protein [Dehalococcoidales bacterium]